MKRLSYFITFASVLLMFGIAAALIINAQSAAQSKGTAQNREAENLKGSAKLKRNQKPQTTTYQAGDYRLSGPYTHENLTIFLVHGKSLITKDFLTLQEALEQKKVVVYETQEVNELAIQNFSNQDVYVQAGDVVKGGQQDRMISIDFIVPPKSGKLPIAAFCVEKGRWSQRANESRASFSSSTDNVATKDIKLAAKRAKSQDEVWKNVAEAQEKLSANLGQTVNATVSESSLQLSLENSKVRESSENYFRELSGILAGHRDVIGYVFAINGQVNSADVYASSSLFRKLWPKSLRANAIEAIAELEKDKPFQPITADQARVFLAEAEDGKVTEEQVANRVTLVTRENDSQMFFETRDRQYKDVWLHRNYLRK